MLDPVGFSISFDATGAEKMLLAIRIGKPQRFDSEEILEFKTNLPLLSSLTPTAGEFELKLFPASVRRSFPLRLSFLRKDEQVVFEWIEFETIRAGTEEVEIATSSTDLPLQIRFVFPTTISRNAKAHVSINKRFVGSEAIQARKGISTLRIIREGCHVELFSLQHEKNLGVIEVPPMQIDISEGMVSWINKMARVSEHFGVRIRLPDPANVNEQDFDSLSFLYALASGEGLPIDSLKVRLVKSEQNSNILSDGFRYPTRLGVVCHDVTVDLFGAQIRVGSYALEVEKAELIDPEQALLEFQRAEIGAGVPLSLRSPESARVFPVRESEELRPEAGPLA